MIGNFDENIDDRKKSGFLRRLGPSQDLRPKPQINSWPYRFSIMGVIYAAGAAIAVLYHWLA